MIGFVMRRLMAAVPAFIAFTILLFVVVSATPPPANLSPHERDRRFLDLPSLYNAQLDDRPRIVRHIVASLATLEGDPRAQAVAHLLRIGAVGLPDLVPALERLPEAARARLARDLAPLAFRMSLDDVADLEVPSKAERYWSDALQERLPDLSPASIRRALERHLGNPAEPLYTRQIRIADTAALAPLLDALQTVPDFRREDVVILAVSAATRAGVQGVVDLGTLRSWWSIHRADYVEFDPLERLAGHITETRFGRWVLNAATHRLGQSWRDGSSVLDDIAHRAPATLRRVALALVFAFGTGLPLAVLTAARRRGPADRASRVVLLLIHATPSFVLALIIRVATASHGDGFLVTALGLGLMAPFARTTRAKLLDFGRMDYVRTARAIGVSTQRIWTFHVLRVALGPVVAWMTLQIPATLAAALVLEEVVGADGLGPATVQALRTDDLPWLLALAVLVAGGCVFLFAAADLVQGIIDPRVREALELRNQES